MLNNELISIADRQINIAIEQQENKLSENIAGIRAELSSRGMYGSSTHVLMVQRACAEAVAERGKFIWEILFRCIKTVETQYDIDLEQQLKSFVSNHIPEKIENLNSRVLEAAQQARMQNLSALPDEVGKARNVALDTLHAEIDLFLMQLKHAPSKATPYSPSQIYIQHSNVGTIQTGSHSIANVSQKIDSNAVTALNDALVKLASELKSVDDLPNYEKSEIVEMVDEGIIELAKEKPNFSKLKSYISVIGTAVGNTVGFAANLKPAYESLKAGALLIGINLP